MSWRHTTAVLALSATIGAGGCGTSPTEDWTQGLARPQPSGPDGTHGFGGTTQARGNNLDALDPMTDLPYDGTDGLTVIRPQGAEVYIRLEYAPGIKGRVEGPNWASNAAAIDRLATMASFIEAALWTGYKQWARHLDGTYVVDVLVGYNGDERCGHSASACYIPALDKVILGEDWLRKNYERLHVGRYIGLPGVEVDVFSELVFVATHEGAHQFDYYHDRGDTRGCASRSDRCHAPRGSGSVVSYDVFDGGRARYAPDQEDVAHIRGGRWNGQPGDVYIVGREGVPESINGYGYWLAHEFNVDGETDWARAAGGTFDVLNNIAILPFVDGTPSAQHGLTGDATWTGDFVGFNLNALSMNALTADAELAYSFAESTMGVAIGNFVSWIGDKPYVKEYPPLNYFAPCSPSGCAAQWEGYVIEVGFFEHQADPSGYAGGWLWDQVARYAGAFSAEKE